MEKISEQTINELRLYAEKYETSAFLDGDPSWFMHQVTIPSNHETIAFIASVLSYGSRSQFMPKIQFFLDASEGHPARWVRSGEYTSVLPDDNRCYYRLYTHHDMTLFLRALQTMLKGYGSMGAWVRSLSADGTKLQAIDVTAAICHYFHERGVVGIIPKDTTSACKRISMFLRWMVRDASPVDLGLWTDIIDKRSLIIPMDTHVVRQAMRLGLLTSKSASMAQAIKLSNKLRQVFPDDPMKGDFALFGYGMEND